MSKEKTVKEHLNEADTVKRLVDDSTAMVKKLKDELEVCREIFEWAEKFNHPEFRMHAPYFLRTHFQNEQVPLASVTRKSVERINAVLGDRA